MRKELWFIPPILIFGLYFAYRLINQAQMLVIFPLDYTNDWASYISQLHFLKVCGFHNYCPYWFNGFTSFLLTPPAWFYFALPLYYLLDNVLYATYFSLIIIFLIGLFAVFYFGKKLQFTKIQSALFFSILFMNANIIGTYVRQGRIAEFFALTLLFILIFLAIWYKDHKFDKKFWLVPFLLAIILLSNQSVTILAMIPLLSLFLVSNTKQKIIITLSIILSLILTVFWWVPFIKNFSSSWGAHLNTAFTGYVLVLNKESLFINLGLTLSALFFLAVIFYNQRKGIIAKRDFIFLLPIIIIAFLAIFRLIALIPPLSYVYLDVYTSFFLFWGLFLFIKSNLTDKIKIGFIILLGLSLASVAISHYHTPYFEPHNKLQSEILDVLPNVRGNFLFLASPNEKVYSKILYTYAPIYHNLTTPSGYHSSMNYDLYAKINSLSSSLDNKSCLDIKNIARDLKIQEIISINPDCNFLESCGLNKIVYSENVCLLQV